MKGDFWMEKINYYNEIKNLIENYEVNQRVRNLQDNSEKLQMNWNIGRLLVEAQDGSKRAKYGDELIRKWAIKLEKIYGKNYSKRNLMLYRKFYLLYPKVNTLCTQLNWSQYRYLLPIKSESERNYYINQVILNHLSVRELREMIKNKSYDRLSYA